MIGVRYLTTEDLLVLVRNHPLGDGNDRLGWLATVVFDGLNGIEIDGPDDHVYDLVVSVAAGECAYRQSAARMATWHRHP